MLSWQVKELDECLSKAYLYFYISSLNSFHVGSGCMNPSVFAQAIADSHRVFEIGVCLLFVFVKVLTIHIYYNNCIRCSNLHGWYLLPISLIPHIFLIPHWAICAQAFSGERNSSFNNVSTKIYRPVVMWLMLHADILNPKSLMASVN